MQELITQLWQPQPTALTMFLGVTPIIIIILLIVIICLLACIAHRLKF